ncbi:MAG: hypothetical protein ACREFK_15165 [Stellaceae bacterium]
MPDLARRRQQAEAMAYALGIALYIGTDGTISQREPVGLQPPGLTRWERIDPAPGAGPTSHGHGAAPQAAATP